MGPYLIGAAIWLLVFWCGKTKEVAKEWRVSAQNRFVDFVQGSFNLAVESASIRFTYTGSPHEEHDIAIIEVELS